MQAGGHLFWESWCRKDNANTPPMRSIKLYAGTDYDFRPESYWGPARSPLEAALRNVKGRNRREMIRDYYSRGLLPALSDNLLRDTLDEDTRRRLDLIHPSFMGGEYLPDYRRDEIEIARIELESTTSDVISVRARPRIYLARLFRHTHSKLGRPLSIDT